ncbi:hypothetical protein V8F20_011265 [Naviculisporaceae sp. PSN 640]
MELNGHGLSSSSGSGNPIDLVLPEYEDRPLTEEEMERYSRQMIVPGMGKEAQLRLIQSKVLIIGAGGLGCPASQYIAGAGVGTIGIVDGDVVEVSNLHRQVGHSTTRIGMTKVESLITHLKSLNPLPKYNPHITHLTPQNASEIISPYDLVLDCTDNPATRYLISDVCVLLGKPLVSAASVQTSGQLVVLNCPPVPQGITSWPNIQHPFPLPPCYRCCFPKPPPPSAMTSCGEAGIIGTVVGLMGVSQAGEAIKILAKGHHRKRYLSSKVPAEEPNFPPSLLIYSYDLEKGPSSATFRSVKMAGRRKTCFACGENSTTTLTLEGIKNGTPNYEQFCSMPTAKVVLPMEERITAKEYHDLLDHQKDENTKNGGILIDTREKEHFSFGAIPGAINIPFGKLLTAAAIAKRERLRSDEGASQTSTEVLDRLSSLLPGDLLPLSGERGATSSRETTNGIDVNREEDKPQPPIYVVCRRGLDSQEAVEKLREMGLDAGGKRKIVDIIGGMKAWKEQVDPTFSFI